MLISKHGSLESAVLSVLWKLEQEGNSKNSVKEVHDTLNSTNNDKKAYTTIKTVMDRLYEKKLLTRIKYGNKFYYKTLHSNTEVIKKSLQELAERFCGGDTKKLISYIENEDNKLVGV